MELVTTPVNLAGMQIRVNGNLMDDLWKLWECSETLVCRLLVHSQITLRASILRHLCGKQHTVQ